MPLAESTAYNIGYYGTFFVMAALVVVVIVLVVRKSNKSSQPQQGPPPGWYPDPQNPQGGQRYWNGQTWQ